MPEAGGNMITNNLEVEQLLSAKNFQAIDTLINPRVGHVSQNDHMIS